MSQFATTSLFVPAPRRIFFALIVGAVSFLVGCDQSSQGVTPQTGDSYVIRQAESAAGDANTGSLLPDGETASVVVPDTVQYYVQGYTINKEYSWSVNGETPPLLESASETYIWGDRTGADGDGDSEFLTVVYGQGDPIATVPGENMVEISAVNSDGSDDGIDTETMRVQAQVPEIDAQLSRLDGLETLASLAISSEVVGQLTDLDGATLFAPRNSVFSEVSDPTQAVDSDEDPKSGVTNQILRYHAVSQEVASSDLPVQNVPTLLGDQRIPELTADRVVQADLPVANGRVHRLDALLLPPTALVDFTDRTLADTSVAKGDTLVIDGSYFPEEGGYIALHEGDAGGEIVGTSSYIEGPTIKNEVKVALEKGFSGSSAVSLVAMPHEESSGNESFDFPSDDPPYEINGGPVTDEAEVGIEDTTSK